MATVSLSPAPHRPRDMTKRRVPLADVPNAANSPFRGLGPSTTKRSRDLVEAREDLFYEEQPPAKRQAFRLERTPLRRSPRKQINAFAEDRVFGKRSANTQPTAFERRLLAAKEPKVSQRTERQEKDPQETLEGIRQWQKHYKKAFPQFVFYFEGIAEDVRVKYSKYVRNLGAREEKFFSKEVTHVVTTRPIPSDNDIGDGSQSTSAGLQNAVQPRTIDPSLLDRQTDAQGYSAQTRNRFTFEAPTNRKAAHNGVRDTESRKSNSSNVDILSKAKEMGMKVWQLEKLQRIMNTMWDIPNDAQPQAGQSARTGARVSTKGERDEDLSRMLHNERVHGPSDRDATVSGEMTIFKGPYIYIRDLEERTKPIMVKEFPKPGKDEQGIWPQFQAVSIGRCPFIPELYIPDRQDVEKDREKKNQQPLPQKVETRPATRSHTPTVPDDVRGENHNTVDQSQRRALQEINNEAKPHVPHFEKPATAQFCPPPSKIRSPLKMATKVVPTTARLFGGEPAASGLQPSNITSAIRSQMNSSTSAAPGAKAGTSKEVHGLKRKVLEKNAGPAPTTMQTRQKTQDSTNARAENTIPYARRPRKQPLVHIAEESSHPEETEDVWLAEDVRTAKSACARKKPVEKRNPKPGYCENCQDKYEDFDDHIRERKHRKFALTSDNWKELDNLLGRLSRQLREPASSDEF